MYWSSLGFIIFHLNMCGFVAVLYIRKIEPNNKTVFRVKYTTSSHIQLLHSLCHSKIHWSRSMVSIDCVSVKYNCTTKQVNKSNVKKFVRWRRTIIVVLVLAQGKNKVVVRIVEEVIPKNQSIQLNTNSFLLVYQTLYSIMSIYNITHCVFNLHI